MAGYIKPKYANPADPRQTWCNRGKQPRWFREALVSGVTREAMLIPAP
jgi:DNA-binding protein H-NS